MVCAAAVGEKACLRAKQHRIGEKIKAVALSIVELCLAEDISELVSQAVENSACFKTS